jgi:hypothetical protein
MRELAKRFGARVSSCTEYDSNVCQYTRNPDEPWRAIPATGTPFSHQARFAYRGRRAGLLANDEYLSLFVAGNFAVRPFTINRMEKTGGFTSVFAMEFMLGQDKYPIFTQDGIVTSAEQKVLDMEELRDLLLSTRLTLEESLHFFGNRINVYLKTPSSNRAETCIDRLLDLADRIEVPEERVDLEHLPIQFHALIPLITKFAIGDDSDREDFLESLPKPALRQLVETVEPFLGPIDSYLDSFRKEPPGEAAAALGRLAECAVEAKHRLGH